MRDRQHAPGQFVEDTLVVLVGDGAEAAHRQIVVTGGQLIRKNQIGRRGEFSLRVLSLSIECSSSFIYITTTDRLRFLRVRISKSVRYRLRILVLVCGGTGSRAQGLESFPIEAEVAAIRLSHHGVPGFDTAFLRKRPLTDIDPRLQIGTDGAQHPLHDRTYPGMAVVPSLVQEGQVIRIQVQGIDQRQWLIVQGIDIAPEATARDRVRGRTD